MKKYGLYRLSFLALLPLLSLPAFFVLRRSIAEKKLPERSGHSADEYFSMLLSELFGSDDKDEKNLSPSEGDDENAQSVEPNRLLEMLKKRQETEREGTHEDENSMQRESLSAAQSGENISDTQDDGAEDNSLAAEDGDDEAAPGIKKRTDTAPDHINSAPDVASAPVPEHVTFNRLGEAMQIFDWRCILRENSSYELDWSYANAVIDEGILCPSLEQTPVAETEILLDTSGSVDEELLKSFLRECRNILPHSRVKIGCFDTNFYGFYEISSPHELEQMRFEGRHGTSFNAAVNAFSPRVDNRIIFTDGEADMPDKKMDIIWIVFGGKKIHPNGGRVFYVDDELIKKLKQTR